MTACVRSTWLLLCVALALGCWRAPYPEDMYLQHIPTVLVLLVWPWALRRYPLSCTALACLALFLLLHIIGARYLYSSVPYERWLHELPQLDLASALDAQRNHYDRMVHFAFGLLWVRPVQEIGLRYAGFSPRAALYVAVEFALAASMLYEVFEWSLTLWLSSEAALAYNGQQGDVWDAQKDRALAASGALAGALLLRMRRDPAHGAAAA